MRILYVNQTGQMSGAEQSLLTLLDAVSGTHEVAVACPEGPLAAEVGRRRLGHRRIRGTDASFTLHPVRTPVALAELAGGSAHLRRLVAGPGRPDVIHANTARAGLLCLGASVLGGPPLVVSLREPLAPNAAGRATQRLLARAAAVVPNSAFMRADLPLVEGRTRVEVVHNAVDVDRFSPARHPREAARAALGLDATTPVLGVVGQLTPWKGQADMIAALPAIRRRHPHAQLLVVGSAKFAAAGTRYDNPAYERQLRAQVAELDLGDAVRFLGDRADVPAVMAALDILLMPSWWEAFGRVAAEAMAMERCVVASAEGGAPEYLRDERDGRLLPPRDPAGWAAVVSDLLDDPVRRAAYGRSARLRVRELLAPARHAARLLALYEAVGTEDRGRAVVPAR